MVITSSKYRFPRTIISNQLIGNIVIECMRIINYSIDYELQKDGCLFCRRTGITTNLVMSTMIPRPVIAITLSMIYRLSRPCNNTLWNDSTSLAALTMIPRPVFAITLSTICRLSRPSCNSNTVWNNYAITKSWGVSQCRRCTLAPSLQSHYRRSIASLDLAIIQCEMILSFEGTSLTLLTMYHRPVFAITLSTICRLSRPSCNSNHKVWNNYAFTRKSRGVSQCRRCTLALCLQSQYRRLEKSVTLAILIEWELILSFEGTSLPMFYLDMYSWISLLLLSCCCVWTVFILFTWSCDPDYVVILD